MSDIIDIMKERHSVRQYLETPIEKEKREALSKAVREINEESGLGIQIIYDEPKCFDSFMAHYGNFSGVSNYIAVVGKKSKDLDVTAGYYGEKLVLEAQKLGLSTCWVALTHGKSKAEVKRGEKQVCLISLGYGKTAGTPHKNRPLEALCNCADNMLENFAAGMSAALLAPTAMNQQKFFFELRDDGSVKATAGKGFYTALDLGIVRYHFDTASGIRSR